MMKNDAKTAAEAGLNILVVESLPVVAEDIIETVREIVEDANVQCFAGPADAADWAAVTAVDVAIISPVAARSELDPLLWQLAALGTRVVLAGDEDDGSEPDREAIRVPRPFTSDMLKRAVRQALNHDQSGDIMGVIRREQPSDGSPPTHGQADGAPDPANRPPH